MRIWDLPVQDLCRQHLLGEHRELHALWVVLTQDKRGYAHHPETLRWRGRLAALHERHTQQAAEIAARGYRHSSPLPGESPTADATEQTELLEPVAAQRALLRAKGCACRV